MEYIHFNDVYILEINLNASAKDMINTIIWTTLQDRRRHIRLILIYENHSQTAIPWTVLISSVLATGKNYSNSYRHILVNKCTCKYSLFPFKLTVWNLITSTLLPYIVSSSWRIQRTAQPGCSWQHHITLITNNIV